jgi:uncharacterized protein YkvS
MDDLLKKALDFSNYRQTLLIQKKVLKEKINSQLTYGYNGGIFKIDRTLISFVQMLVDQGRVENIPLLDLNENPVIIDNLEDFRDEILDRYFTSLYEYHEKYQVIRKSRTVEKLVDL